MLSPIVICTEIENCEWRWIENRLGNIGIRFEFVRCASRNSIERFTRFNFARLWASFKAVQLSRRLGATAIVTHGPTLAAWCGLFSLIFRQKIPIIAHSFNFPDLP